MSFKQLWGSVSIDSATRIPTRVYDTLAAATHFSPAWAMDSNERGLMGVEIDTSDGSLLVATTLVLQRSSMPRELGGVEHSTEAGVHWHDVPAEEATLTLPNADGHEAMYEWSFSAAAIYRLKLIVGTQGNIWAAATPGGG